MIFTIRKPKCIDFDDEVDDEFKRIIYDDGVRGRGRRRGNELKL